MKTANAQFVKSAGNAAGFIRDDRSCVVFAGKSNVGKSSVINCLLSRKNLARVGASPGKTTNVNYFLVDGKVWFVDLPGYGYAKVSQAERERWGVLMEAFFAEPERIDLGIQIVDARHDPTELDRMMTALFIRTERPFIVCANKLDKLKKSEIEPNLAAIRRVLELPPEIVVMPFSAEKGTGKSELLAAISSVVG